MAPYTKKMLLDNLNKKDLEKICEDNQLDVIGDRNALAARIVKAKVQRPEAAPIPPVIVVGAAQGTGVAAAAPATVQATEIAIAIGSNKVGIAHPITEFIAKFQQGVTDATGRLITLTTFATGILASLFSLSDCEEVTVINSVLKVDSINRLLKAVMLPRGAGIMGSDLLEVLGSLSTTIECSPDVRILPTDFESIIPAIDGHNVWAAFGELTIGDLTTKTGGLSFSENITYISFAMGLGDVKNWPQVEIVLKRALLVAVDDPHDASTEWLSIGSAAASPLIDTVRLNIPAYVMFIPCGVADFIELIRLKKLASRGNVAISELLPGLRLLAALRAHDKVYKCIEHADDPAGAFHAMTAEMGFPGVVTLNTLANLEKKLAWPEFAIVFEQTDSSEFIKILGEKSRALLAHASASAKKGDIVDDEYRKRREAITRLPSSAAWKEAASAAAAGGVSGTLRAIATLLKRGTGNLDHVVARAITTGKSDLESCLLLQALASLSDQARSVVDYVISHDESGETLSRMVGVSFDLAKKQAEALIAWRFDDINWSDIVMRISVHTIPDFRAEYAGIKDMFELPNFVNSGCRIVRKIMAALGAGTFAFDSWTELATQLVANCTCMAAAAVLRQSFTQFMEELTETTQSWLKMDKWSLPSLIPLDDSCKAFTLIYAKIDADTRLIERQRQDGLSGGGAAASAAVSAVRSSTTTARGGGALSGGSPAVGGGRGGSSGSPTKNAHADGWGSLRSLVALSDDNSLLRIGSGPAANKNIFDVKRLSDDALAGKHGSFFKGKLPQHIRLFAACLSKGEEEKRRRFVSLGASSLWFDPTGNWSKDFQATYQVADNDPRVSKANFL